MTSTDIRRVLRNRVPYRNIFIPEFTYEGRRVDAVIIDTDHRWVRGYEIKTSRSDWLRDIKWTEYTAFCSSLSIVCPEGLIRPEEVNPPFGLLWIVERHFPDNLNRNTESMVWKRKPRNFQQRNSLAWLWTYVNVLESEFSRMHYAQSDLELRQLRQEQFQAGQRARLTGSEQQEAVVKMHPKYSREIPIA